MPELSSLHVKITGDSADLTSSLKGPLAGFANLQAVVGKTQTALNRGASANKKIAAAFRQVSANSLAAAASTRTYNVALKSLNSAASTGQAAQAKLGAASKTTASNFAVAGSQVTNFTGDIRTSRFHTANLTAQFNDIGVMLNSGQSPFTLAIQQGTQITQVLQTMGGTAKEQIGQLIVAFKAMISPTAIAVVAIIAIGVVLARIGIKFLAAKGFADNYKDSMKRLEETLTGLKTSMSIFDLTIEEQTKRWGNARDAVIAYAVAANAVKLDRARAEIKETFLTLGKGIAEFTSANVMGGIFGTSEKNLARLAARNIKDALETNPEDAIILRDAFDELEAAEGIEKQAESMLKLLGLIDEFGAKMPEALKPSIEKMAALVQLTAEIETLMESIASGVVTGVSPSSGGKEKEDDEFERLIEQIRKRAELNDRANEEEFIRIQESFFTKLEMEEQFHDDRMSIIAAFHDQRKENEEAANDLSVQEAQRHNNAIVSLEQRAAIRRLNAVAGFFGDAANLTAQGGKKLFAITQILAVAEGLVHAYGAYLKALDDPTIPSTFARIALAVTVLGIALKAVASMKSVKPGSGGGRGAAPAAAGQVEPQETSNVTSVNIALRGQVFDRGAVIGLIEQINEAVGDGARIRTV